jgi:DeoR/GlpR family transcriptional regulator of sugar metabolism
MRRYEEIEHDILALLRTQPLSSSRYVIKNLTERGHVSTQAVRNTLKALAFDGKITNVGGESAVWKVGK